MALIDVFKINRKTFFNPRAWIGYDFLRAQTLFILNTIGRLFIPDTPQREENFTEALDRLGITEEDAENSARNYFSYAIFFLALSIFTFFFGFFLLFFYGTFSGLLLSFSTTSLLLVQAFRFHFWYFQIKTRKLGNTYNEWKEFLFKGNSSE